MTTLTSASPSMVTLADLLERLGDIPLERVRVSPRLGDATEQDVLDIERREKRLCELVDGVLVEKPMGYLESIIAVRVITALMNFVTSRDLGFVSGEAGMMRLLAGLVRIPDVAFVSRKRLPGGQLPNEPIPQLVPDLAIEVLSPSNTPGEMRRKLGEYFEAGVELVWLIDPRSRSAMAYTAPDQAQKVEADGALDGLTVLPGFSLPLQELFAGLPA